MANKLTYSITSGLSGTAVQKRSGHHDVGVNTSDAFARAYQLQCAGKFHRAAQAYLELIRNEPKNASALNNFGNCLRSIGQFEKSIRCFDQALAIDPGKCSSRLNRGLALLALDRYREAWPDYETRLETISYRSELLQQQDRKWKGQSLGANSVLYLYSSQGLGDELQCLRFVPIAAARVAKVILELQKPTAALVSGLPKNVTVIQRGEKVPSFDQWAELFSLPGIFDIGVDTLPMPVRPIYTPDLRVKSFIESEGSLIPNQLKIGLVWSGNPDNSLNSVRACGLAHLKPLLQIPNCKFYSLQLGKPAVEIAQQGLSDEVEDLSPFLGDFGSTATAIDTLDLVISTDTSVPHLAGTLGAETWLMLQEPADWRWGQSGDDSAWYPSLRLFRQTLMGNWAEVVERVASALLKRAS